MITIKAPGKVIISGEHAVVYGKPALVCSIDRYLTFSLFESKEIKEHKIVNKIAEIVKKYLINKKIQFKDKSYAFSIKSEIPVGYGLGSSAALSVAAVAAFLRFYTNEKFDKETVNNLSYKAEKLFHTNPSGVDNTAACFGGIVFFRREFEFLKTISLLTYKIPKNIEDALYLINSGKPQEKTKDMVGLVGNEFNQNPKNTERVFSEIERMTKQITISLIKEDILLFKKALTKNQALLDELHIISEKTKQLLSDIKPYGVGKVTGAGGLKKGSGYILFCAENETDMKKYLDKNSISYFKFKQSYEGYSKSSR